MASLGLSVSLCVIEGVGLGYGAQEKGSDKQSQATFLPTVVSSSCHSMAPGASLSVWWHSDSSAAMRVIPT